VETDPLDGFRRSSEEWRKAAWQSGAATLLMGTLVLNSDTLIFSAFLLFLGGWFAFDAARYIYLRGCSDFPGTALYTSQNLFVFVMLRKPPRISARHLRQCYANLPE
jgi:hypothetical protein